MAMNLHTRSVRLVFINTLDYQTIISLFVIQLHYLPHLASSNRLSGSQNIGWGVHWRFLLPGGPINDGVIYPFLYNIYTEYNL